MNKLFFVTLCFLFAFTCLFAQQIDFSARRSLFFDFGNGKAKMGYVKVYPESIYNDETGYGIDLGTKVFANSKIGDSILTDGFLSSREPFYFSVKLPEGNYNVKVFLGDDNGVSDVAIRAESRRMFVNRLQTSVGKHHVVEFTVNIRDSLIAGIGKKVRLKPRERQYLTWDNKLTIEFNSLQPKVNAIEITPTDQKAVSVFLAGNSTVVDGAHEPFSAWGQMFPFYFQPEKVAVVNLAESGETLSSFIGERRFAKMLSMIKPGDYAFVEFGHNDQKQKGEGVGPFTSYKKDLEYFISEVKKKGGIPVLVTSVQRRNFNEKGEIVQTLGDYPEAVRLTAKEQDTYLIDLNAMSKTMLEAMGVKSSLMVFAHFPAFQYPGRSKPIEDNTHFRPFGAYQISKLILKGVRDNKMPLADLVKETEPTFNPNTPDDYSQFYWPESPGKDATKPDGD